MFLVFSKNKTVKSFNCISLLSHCFHFMCLCGSVYPAIIFLMKEYVLFSVIVLFDERVDGKGVSAQLEGAVDVPALCSGQELELLVGGEHEMATTTYFNV